MKTILKFLKSWKNWIKILLFLPIIFVLIISLSHMIDWFSLTDEIGWATFLSTAIVLITFSTIAASRITKWSFLAYSVVFLIELCGNYFHAFTHIQRDSEAFTNWNLAIEPLFELFFYNADIVTKMRFLAIIQGGALPILALIFFTFWIYLLGIEDVVEESTDEIEEDSEQEIPPYIQSWDNDAQTNTEKKVEEIAEIVEPSEIIEVEALKAIINDTAKADNDKVKVRPKVTPTIIREDGKIVEPKKTYVGDVKDDKIQIKDIESKTPQRLVNEADRIIKKHSTIKQSNKQSGEPEKRIIDNKKTPQKNVIRKVLKSDNKSNEVKSNKQVKITDSRIRTKKDNFKSDKK